MKKGYYLIHRNIPPLVGLAYCSAGGDDGFTYEDACEQQKTNPEMVVINKDGKVVFPFYITHEANRQTDDF